MRASVPRRAKGPLALFLGAAVSLGACASLEVAVDIDTDAEFSALCTYAWAEENPSSSGHAVVDDNTLLDDRVRRAVFGQLEKKGLYQAAGGSPDLTVHYHAVLARNTRTVHYRNFDEQGGVRLATSEQTETFTVTEGTLLVDIHDAVSDRLIWRGAAKDLGRELTGDRERLDATVDEAVTQMFATYPQASSACRQEREPAERGD